MKFFAIIFAVFLFQAVLIRCDDDDEDDEDEDNDNNEESQEDESAEKNENDDDDEENSDEDDDGSDTEHFKVTYRFLAHNAIELKMKLESAQALVAKKETATELEFRKFYNDFVRRIKGKDKTGAGGKVEQSDYENIYNIILSCFTDFKKVVEDLKNTHKKDDYRRVYVMSKRDHTCSEFKNKADVFAVKK